MAVGRISTPLDIAISGLRAESLRMKIIADNIANAKTSRTQEGGPYRRQDLVLSAGREPLSGVEIQGVVEDLKTDLKDVYMPGHPDAGQDGMVRMPNVDIPVEMMNMLLASRAYQANTAVLKRYQDLVSAALEVLR